VYKSDILRIWAGELRGGENLIYVGDRGADIEAAHSAGLKAVGVTFGYGSRDELSSAEALIDSMDQLLNVLPRLFPKSKS
jgi:phosphoglycolate phosphatase